MNAEAERKLTEAEFARKKSVQDEKKKAEIVAHAKDEQAQLQADKARLAKQATAIAADTARREQEAAALQKNRLDHEAATAKELK